MFTKLNKENSELPNNSHVSGLCDPELLTQDWLGPYPVLHWNARGLPLQLCAAL